LDNNLKIWVNNNLGNICSLITDGKHGDCINQKGSGYYFLSAKDVSSGTLNYDNVREITFTDFIETHRRTNLEPGDILITNSGTIGRMAIAKNDEKTLRTTFQKSVAVLKPKIDLVKSNFLYYHLLSLKDHLVELAGGTTQQNLLLGDLRKLKVTLPPLPEQKAIADILSSLDDKIDLNNQMNKTLEQMARAIFKRWFVDFEFPLNIGERGGLPRAESRGYKSSGGKMVESEMGMIPERWEVEKLSDICTLGRGASPRPINDFMNGEVPWIKIADATRANGPFLFETKEKLKTIGVDKSVKVVPGDLILSNSATCGIPIFVELHGCIHDGWLYFKNLSSISNIYLFHVLIELSEHLVHIADGSVQKNLNTNLVGQQYVLIPPALIKNEFDLLANSLFARIKMNSLESQTLCSLRDSLLPKLMSGELRVHAEKIKEYEYA
jgi:type I restriction enzyme S subunit